MLLQIQASRCVPSRFVKQTENVYEKLCKKKVTKKFVPPDIPAMKLLLEVFDKQVPLTEMSEQELQQEKKRLLLELEKLKGEKDGD